MATDFMSMAAKLSDSGDKMSEANLQADGQAEKPAQGTADQQETEEEDSSHLTHQHGPLSRGHH